MQAKKPRGGKAATKGTTKELVLEHTKMNMWGFKYKDGGQIPNILQGEWNNKRQAMTVKEAYLNNRDLSANGKKPDSQAV